MAERNNSVPTEKRIEFRVGINLGDVIAEGEDIFGDGVLDGRSEDPEADRLKGTDFARRALEVAGDGPGILVDAAVALAYFGEDIGAMMALVDRALALNSSYARGWHISGLLRLWAGQPDVAIEHNEVALRLSPRARIGHSLFQIGEAHFLSRRFDEAVPKLLLAIHSSSR